MFRHVKSKKVYQHVVEQIQLMAMNGQLKKGDKLPSERDLAEELGVSRTSIREALRSLEMIGLVECRQGEGNFIGGNISGNFFQPLSVMFMLNHGNPRDIFELRETLEMESVSIAARKIREEGRQEDIRELYELMERLRKVSNGNDSHKVDFQIHYKISEITGNYLLMMLFNTISSLMSTFVENTREIILVDRESRENLFREHKNLVDAVAAGDSLKARKAMRVHLNTIFENMEQG
jgi:GntR family transcriptional repressor for pyruvate dehydrogenase complex